MSSSYLPAPDADRVLWLNNFASRLGNYRTTFGFTIAQVNAVQADADMFAYIVQLQDAFRQYWVTISNLKKQLRSSSQQQPAQAIPVPPNIGSPPSAVSSGIFNRTTLLVNTIKQHSNYTTAIGSDLNIIAPANNLNPATMMPNLTIRIESGFPLLKWTKGQADGVQLYVDRRDGNGFVPLAKVIRNSFIDSQPLPINTITVSWDYKARYLLGDDEVGLFSSVISINVLRPS